MILSSFLRKTLIVVALAAGCLIGCSRPPYDVVHVRGQVRVDGKPLTFGRIMFAPIANGNGINAGKPAFGQIRPDGSYDLTTYNDQDGAVVGEHWVSIFGTNDSAPTAAVGQPSTKSLKFQRVVVPEKKRVLAGADNVIDIDITSKDIVRFASKHND